MPQYGELLEKPLFFPIIINKTPLIKKLNIDTKDENLFPLNPILFVSTVTQPTAKATVKMDGDMIGECETLSDKEGSIRLLNDLIWSMKLIQCFHIKIQV